MEEAPPVERRLVAILAADVEGYSRLMHGDEDATMATLSARRCAGTHRDYLHSKIKRQYNPDANVV
jgi:hypothetical protein